MRNLHWKCKIHFKKNNRKTKMTFFIKQKEYLFNYNMYYAKYSSII